MTGRVRIAIGGAGLIGTRHIEEVDASASADLAAIVDPGPAGSELAEKFGVPLHASLAELFARDRPDGVLLATPNQLHVGSVWRPASRSSWRSRSTTPSRAQRGRSRRPRRRGCRC